MGGGVRKPKVIVVGGGISGVEAAATLQKSGAVDVVLLEASQRLGGRIYSNEVGGEKVEMGANWIHGTEGSPIMEVAQQHGLLNLSSGPWGGTRWTGENKYRREGGGDADPAVVKEMKGLFKKLIMEAQLIGARSSATDKASLAAVEAESVGSHLRRGFHEYLERGQLQRAANGTGSERESFEEERWEDEWAGAEVLAEPGRSAVAYQETPSASAGPAAGSLLHERDDQQSHPVAASSSTAAEEAVPAVPAEGSSEASRLHREVLAMRGRLECCISAVHSLEDLSLRWFGEYEEYPGPHVTIAQGYSRVVEILAAQLEPNTVKFGQEVTQIRWAPEGSPEDLPVQVMTAQGSVFSGDHVMVTVSLGVLKERAAGCGPTTPQQNLFSPPLPDWKVECIRRMGFGVVDKIFLQFPQLGIWGDQCLGLEMLWREESSSNPASAATDAPLLKEPAAQRLPNWTRKLFAFHPINIRSTVVVSWIAGEEALVMESLPDAEVKQTCVDTILQFLPEDDRPKLPEPTAVLRTRWGTDPLFRGSYSYVAVGSSGDDIDRLAQPLPAAREGSVGPALPAGSAAAPLQLLFAGEATHRHSYSNTHGAFHSGRREAERVLQLYNISCSN